MSAMLLSAPASTHADGRDSDRVAQGFFEEETAQLLNILNDHLYALSIDGGGNTPQDTARILESVKDRLLDSYQDFGDAQGVMKAEVDAAFEVIRARILGGSSQQGTTTVVPGASGNTSTQSCSSGMSTSTPSPVGASTPSAPISTPNGVPSGSLGSDKAQPDGSPPSHSAEETHCMHGTELLAEPIRERAPESTSEQPLSAAFNSGLSDGPEDVHAGECRVEAVADSPGAASAQYEAPQEDTVRRDVSARPRAEVSRRLDETAEPESDAVGGLGSASRSLEFPVEEVAVHAADLFVVEVSRGVPEMLEDVREAAVDTAAVDDAPPAFEGVREVLFERPHDVFEDPPQYSGDLPLTEVFEETGGALDDATPVFENIREVIADAPPAFEHVRERPFEGPRDMVEGVDEIPGDVPEMLEEVDVPADAPQVFEYAPRALEEPFFAVEEYVPREAVEAEVALEETGHLAEWVPIARENSNDSSGADSSAADEQTAPPVQDFFGEEGIVYEYQGPQLAPEAPTAFIQENLAEHDQAAGVAELVMVPQIAERPAAVYEPSGVSYLPHAPLGEEPVVEALAEVHAPQTEAYREAPMPVSPTKTCALCLEDKPSHSLVDVPCGHAFDIACLVALVKTAVENEPLFPPRCCNHSIPQSTLDLHLDPALRALYEAKKHEYSTLKRLYCGRAQCGAFIGERLDEPASVQCPKCGERSCGACGSQAHASWHACEAQLGNDENILIALGKEQQWQRCPACQRIVERTGGCPHMTCFCKQQFCYLCGAEYTKCEHYGGEAPAVEVGEAIAAEEGELLAADEGEVFAVEEAPMIAVEN